MRTYEFYQLTDADSNHYYRFEPLETLKNEGMAVEFLRYHKVYEGTLSEDEGLESLYRKFNIDHPADFRGHSMSVSDVVVITDNGVSEAYYCDSYGFQEVPEFMEGREQKEEHVRKPKKGRQM